MLRCVIQKPTLTNGVLKGVWYYRDKARVAVYKLTTEEKHGALFTLPRHGYFANLNLDILRELYMYLSAGTLIYISQEIPGMLSITCDTLLWKCKLQHDLGIDLPNHDLATYIKNHKAPDPTGVDWLVRVRNWAIACCTTGNCRSCRIIRGDIHGFGGFTKSEMWYVYLYYPSKFSWMVFRSRYPRQTAHVVRAVWEDGGNIDPSESWEDNADVTLWMITKGYANKYAEKLYPWVATIPKEDENVYDGTQETLQEIYEVCKEFKQWDFLCWIVRPLDHLMPKGVLNFLVSRCSSDKIYPYGTIREFIKSYIESSEDINNLNYLASILFGIDEGLSNLAAKRFDVVMRSQRESISKMYMDKLKAGKWP